MLTLLMACGGGGLEPVAESNAGIVMNLNNAAEGDTVKLTLFKEMGNDIEVVEKAVVQQGGKVTLAWQPEVPSIVRASIDKTRAMNLVLEPGDKAMIEGELADFGSTTITGSEESQRYQAFNQARANFQAQSSGADMRMVQSAKGGLMRDLLALMREKHGSVVSLVAAAELMRINDGRIPNDFFDIYVKVLDASKPIAANSPQYVAISGYLDPIRATMPGQPAPELMFNNPDGEPVALSSLRGKVVLIDFWASWCRPCRAENPNVVRLYNKYKDKGFDIYSVSLDRDKRKWVGAIAQDGLDWTHVSDLQAWQSAAAQIYSVHSIPMTFLIDKDGTILDRGLRGALLEKRLEEILGPA